MSQQSSTPVRVCHLYQVGQQLRLMQNIDPPYFIYGEIVSIDEVSSLIRPGVTSVPSTSDNTCYGIARQVPVRKEDVHFEAIQSHKVSHKHVSKTMGGPPAVKLFLFNSRVYLTADFHYVSAGPQMIPKNSVVIISRKGALSRTDHPIKETVDPNNRVFYYIHPITFQSDMHTCL